MSRVQQRPCPEADELRQHRGVKSMQTERGGVLLSPIAPAAVRRSHVQSGRGLSGHPFLSGKIMLTIAPAASGAQSAENAC